MRKILTALLLSTPLIIVAPAFARGFNSTIQTQLTSAVNVEVVLSEDMVYRANNLPKNLRDRGHARSYNDGFSGNGFYGDKELEDLTQFIEARMIKRLSKKGVKVDDDAPMTLRVTLEDAKPNRPTFEQLKQQVNLSYNSFGVGGAELTAELIDDNGQSLGVINYERYDNDIREAQYGGTWTDAKQAIRKFSKKTAKALAN